MSRTDRTRRTISLPAVCGTCRWHLTMRSRSGEITWCDLARKLVLLDGVCPAWRSAVDMPARTHEDCAESTRTEKS